MLKKLLNLQIKHLKKLSLKNAYKLEHLIKRAISRQEFSDFYALDAIAPYFEGGAKLPEGLSPEIRKKIDSLLLRRNKLVWDIANYYAQSMYKAMIGEYQSGAPTWPGGDKEKSLLAAGVPLPNFDWKESSKSVSSMAKDYTPSQLVAGFKYLNWPSAYGGEPWANIAQLYKELNEEIKGFKSFVGEHQVIRWHMDGTFRQKLGKLVTLIDRINQAEHNTGSLFTHFQGGEDTWITDALNEKAIPSSLKRLRTKTSPEVGDVVKELDQEPYVDEMEIGGQIAEVQLSRQIRKRMDKEEHNYKRRLEDLEKDKNAGNLNEKSYLRYKEELERDYRDSIKQYENPLSETNIDNLMHSGVKAKDVLGLLLKHPNALNANFSSLAYRLNLWTLDPIVLRKLFSIEDIRNRAVDSLIERAKDALYNESIDDGSVNLIWNVFQSIPLRKFTDKGFLNVLKIFRAHRLDISRFENIERQLKSDPYGIMDNPEIFQDKQLELFSAFKLSKRQLLK